MEAAAATAAAASQLMEALGAVIDIHSALLPLVLEMQVRMPDPSNAVDPASTYSLALPSH